MNQHLGEFKVNSTQVCGVKPHTAGKMQNSIFAGLCVWADIHSTILKATEDVGSQKIMLFILGSKAASREGFTTLLLSTSPQISVNGEVPEVLRDGDDEFDSISFEITVPSASLSLYHATLKSQIPMQILIFSGRPPRGVASKVISSKKVLFIVATNEVDLSESLLESGVDHNLANPVFDNDSEDDELEDEIFDASRVLLWSAASGVCLNDDAALTKLESLALWGETNFDEKSEYFEQADDLVMHVLNLLSMSKNSYENDSEADLLESQTLPQFYGTLKKLYDEYYNENCLNMLSLVRMPDSMFLMEETEDTNSAVLTSLGVTSGDDFNPTEWLMQVKKDLLECVDVYGFTTVIYNAVILAAGRATKIKNWLSENGANTQLNYAWTMAMWLTLPRYASSAPDWVLPALSESFHNFDPSLAVDIFTQSNREGDDFNPLLSGYVHNISEMLDTVINGMYDDFVDWVQKAEIAKQYEGSIVKLIRIVEEAKNNRDHGPQICGGCEMLTYGANCDDLTEQFVKPMFFLLSHLADYHTEINMCLDLGGEEWSTEHNEFIKYVLAYKASE